MDSSPQRAKKSCWENWSYDLKFASVLLQKRSRLHVSVVQKFLHFFVDLTCRCFAAVALQTKHEIHRADPPTNLDQCNWNLCCSLFVRWNWFRVDSESPLPSPM